MIDEKKRREILGLGPANAYQGAKSTPTKPVASFSQFSPPKPATALPPEQIQAKPATSQSRGAAVNQALRKSFSEVGKTIGASKQVFDANVASPVVGFTRGLVTGQAEAPAPTAVGPAQSTPQPAPAAPVAQPLPNRMPTNADPLATSFIQTNSQAAGDKVNARNTVPVPGLEGVGYAGNYGGTEVFRGKGAAGEASFADIANLATTRGGEAAPLPKQGEAGFGNQVVNNSTGIDFDPDQNKDGLADQTSPELVKARQAAMARGDYSAVERSMMTSAQRKAADEAQSFANLQRNARKKDPVATYQNELSGVADQLKAAYDTEKDTARQTRYDKNAKAANLKMTSDTIMKLMPLDDMGVKDVNKAQEYIAKARQLADQYPDMTPTELAQIAMGFDPEMDAQIKPENKLPQ